MVWLTPKGLRPSLVASPWSLGVVPSGYGIGCQRMMSGGRGGGGGGGQGHQSVSPRRTHYDVLGLNEGASSEDIKQAYYNLSKVYHPDRNQEDPASMAKFQEVTQAHDILGNPALRRQYDKGTLGHNTSVADLERAAHTYDGQRFYETRTSYQKRYGFINSGGKHARSSLDHSTRMARQMNFSQKQGRIRSTFSVNQSSHFTREDGSKVTKFFLYSVTTCIVGIFLARRLYS